MYLPRAATLVLIVAVMFPILFGGLMHAVIPHTHSDNAVIAADMHSAFRHEEYVPLALPVVSFVFILVVTVLAISYRRIAHSGRLVRERHKITSALRRGVVLYRRFG